MATTRSRPRGRESARPSTGGVATEHAAKIYSVAAGAIVITVAFLALTSIGHVIDAATQHFMLFYAGVFALIALCASVGLGLVATDRMILNPGHRIFVQSAHRAASFGALAFLIIHIVTEILAQRVHALDAFVPFLSPFRTFYIGLGTIASDLILLLVITSILRKRFTAHGKAWRWRAIHYTSYVAFVFGVWHGLLGGRPGKPYVDWSYGFVIAFVALGLAVRILANSLRPKEKLSGPAVAESTSSGSAPMRAASMFAQLGVVRAAASASAAVSAPTMAQGMLSAPVGGWDVGPATGPTPALAVLPASPALPDDGRQPFYEPGYVGPPRYVGAPRSSGTGPMPQVNTGLPRVLAHRPAAATDVLLPCPGRPPGRSPGRLPVRFRRSAAEPGAGRARCPARPAVRSRAPPPARCPASGRARCPRAGPGPLPAIGPGYGAGPGGGAAPRGGSGPMPRAATGPMPRAATGPMPRAATGPMPRAATGPMPRAGAGRCPALGRARCPRPGRDRGRRSALGTAQDPAVVPRRVAGAVRCRVRLPSPARPDAACRRSAAACRHGADAQGGERPDAGAGDPAGAEERERPDAACRRGSVA